MLLNGFGLRARPILITRRLYNQSLDITKKIHGTANAVYTKHESATHATKPPSAIILYE
jgi:hypothetical protein